MKIAHIITTHELGGAQLSTFRLLKELSKIGKYEVLLIYGEKGPLLDSYRIQKNIRLIQIKSLKRVIGIKDLLALFEIIFVLKKEKVSLIHTHSTKPSLIGRVAAFILNISFIHTYHGFGHDYYKNKLIQKCILVIESILNNLSYRIIFICKENQTRALNLKLVKKEKALLIHDFLDLENIDYQKQYHNKINSIIGSVISFKEQKRPFELIKLFYRLSKKYNFIKEFYVIGDGPLFEKCKKLKDTLNFDKLKMPGATLNIQDYYKKIDLMVSLSRFEGLSMVQVESIYRRIPLVVTKAGGIDEWLKDGEQGFVVPNNDIEEAFKKISYIIDGNFTYKSLDSKKLECFDTDKLLKKYVKLYELKL